MTENEHECHNPPFFTISIKGREDEARLPSNRENHSHIENADYLESKLEFEDIDIGKNIANVDPTNEIAEESFSPVNNIVFENYPNRAEKQLEDEINTEAIILIGDNQPVPLRKGVKKRAKKMKKILQCSQCSYKTSDVNEFSAHFITKENLSQCKVKLGLIPPIVPRKRGRPRIHPRPDKALTECSLCDFKGTKVGVESHTKEAHTRYFVATKPHKDIPVVTCGNCSYRTDSLTDLQHHSKLHALRCELCNYQTVSAKLFEIHRKFHFQSLNKKADRNELNSVKAKKSGLSWNFRCQECDFQTDKPALLQNHKSVHEKGTIYEYNIQVNGKVINVYSCRECSYETNSFDSLVNHQFIHGRTGQSFNCEWCDYKTRYRKTLTKHISKLHGDKVSTDNNNIVASENKKKEKTKKTVKKANKNVIVVSSDSDSDGHVGMAEIQKCKNKKKRKLNSSGSHAINLTNLDSDGSELKTSQDIDSDLENLLDSAAMTRERTNSTSSSNLEDSKSKDSKCLHCNFTSKKREIYFKHLIGHGGTKKMYVCESCEFFSSEKRNLANHLLTHAKSYKVYLCECGFSNDNKGRLKSHKKTECRLRVKSCRCGFETRSDLSWEKHKKNHCPLDSDENSSKRIKKKQAQGLDISFERVGNKFHCPLCFFKSSCKHSLKRHYSACHVEERS